VTLLVLVALLAAGAVALMAWGNSEFTDCYARFSSEADAEAVADDLGDVDVDIERRDGEFAATFTTGESGEDARSLRRAFRSAVLAQDGELGHPGDGCLERGPIT
jgi:hypothetical protein